MGRVEQEYSTGVEEVNTQTLDTRGRPENEAQKEKKRYDLRKSANIKIYNRQLNSVRSAIRSAEKDLRGEKKKVEDARTKGYSDPTSEAQIKVIEAVLAEHRALYEKVSELRDVEQGKKFELPVQGTDLFRFQPMDIGGYDKYAVRYGKGPELAKPEDIEKLVDLKKVLRSNNEIEKFPTVLQTSYVYHYRYVVNCYLQNQAMHGQKSFKLSCCSSSNETATEPTSK